MLYTVHYQAGIYEGSKTVRADDEEQAIAKVKKFVRGFMTTPLYSESYKVVEFLDGWKPFGSE